MRYERKYRVETQQHYEVLEMVRGHRMSFRTLYPDRQVNNIYLDTPNLQFYRENLSGVGQRRKYRIRWYHEDIQNVTRSVLEVKIKDNELGEKVIAPMPDMQLGDYAGMRAAIDAALHKLNFSEEGVQSGAHGTSLVLIPPLHPVLVNTYLRSYFISYCGRYRLTVDRDMHFYGVDHHFNAYRNHSTDSAVVVEVKYEEEDDMDYDQVGQFIPYRLGKNSKYVNGVNLTGNV